MRSALHEKALAPTSVSSAHTTYELHTLGWKAFQDLCTAVASEVLARPVQTFLSSHDGGRDGAFVGTWRGAPSDPGAKSTIQCKFFSKAGANLALSHLLSEMNKLRRLARAGLAHDYIVMTNAGISATTEAKIVVALEHAGAKTARVFGRDWLAAQIRERPRLRMMVPRLYGLGDLSQIIDVRAYAQAAQILSAMGDDLRCFVITDAYRKSVEALTKHGFVLFLGDPASGKSTIGASLAVGALDNGSVGTIRITSPEELATHWNPNEPSQFFWVDDAFGPTQYQRHLVDGWNHQLPLLRGALKAGARMLFTSRNYIWEAARRDLKIGQFPLLRESQVIINVQALTKAERAQILYNHIKMGDQPKGIRRMLKPLLPAVCSNEAFLPETARRLGSKIFTKHLVLEEGPITDFVEHPVELLKDVLRNLDDSAKAAIALIFLYGSAGVPSPVPVSEAMQTVSRLVGVSHAAVTKALETLNGSITLLVQTPEGGLWRYKHPTISDAFAGLVAESAELVEIYVTGAKIDRLLDEVVCGKTKIAGAQVRVPPMLYDTLIIRLQDAYEGKVRRFLTNRCDASFIEKYLKMNPSMLNDLSDVSYELYLDSRLEFCAKLLSVSLLPEEVRRRVAEKIAQETISMVDASVFHANHVRSLLTHREFAKLERRFECEIVDKLDNVMYHWEHDWSTSDHSSHMYSLAENLGYFQKYQANRKTSSTALSLGIRRIEERASELAEEARPRQSLSQPSAPKTSAEINRIFVDVDE